MISVSILAMYAQHSGLARNHIRWRIIGEMQDGRHFSEVKQ